MNGRLKKVLLIDDDDATNFLNKKIISATGYFEEADVACNGIEALEFLKLIVIAHQPKPNLILLDLNMPRMDGWEFLKEYKKLGIKKNGHPVIVVLTTSVNPDDAERAKLLPCVSAYVSKPLGKNVLDEICNQYL